MFRLNTKLCPAVLAVASALAAPAAQAVDPALAPWLVQMGETSAILSAANWGKGQILGVVDTGIVAGNSVFAPGQVSVALSTCAAVSFRCANGVNDDNGHGTAVASMAAANRVTTGTYTYSGYTVKAGSYIGVAPNANIVAEKVLNASGSGYNTDVSNGINKAVAAGASVINLSLTYMATPDIVTAINNAAAKGAFIVWAGGNESTALLGNANTSGLTANAVKHLIFAGALDPTAAKAASFSNNAGTGALVDTAGGKTTYAARWIAAPGVNILAPYALAGSGAMALWSGTSMSAPLVSGSLLLLESAWPILKTNGTAANLLLTTATDLGTKGIDNTYGNGLVNLGTAFQPVGALSVTQANGKTLAVSSITGAMITGGALGSLAAVKASLANYAAFDTYQRNFTVNLSGLIASKPTGASLNALPSNTNTGVTVMKFNDGGELASWQLPVANMVDRMGVFWNNDGYQSATTGYLSYTSAGGSTVAMGYGVPVQFSYAKALYGDENMARMAGELGSSNLLDLAQGGYHLAYGMRMDAETRVAVAFTQTPTGFYAGNPAWGQTTGASTASNLTVGVTRKLSDDLTGGLSFAQLDEKSGLLGSTYGMTSVLGLGANSTTNVGLSLAYRFDGHNSLLAETGFAFTRGASGNGLLAGTSEIQSRSWGLTLLSRQVLNREDRLALSIKQPLRVSSGSVSVITPSLDDAGVAHYGSQKLTMVPTGRELDFKVAYDTPLRKNQTLSLQLGARRDVANIAGQNDASVGAIWSARF